MSSEEVDLFGEETAEETQLREKKASEAAEASKKKEAKGTKSSILLDVKPWEAETDMAVLEAEVRKINPDGLTWGASKLIDIGYGVKKLQIMITLEDEKVEWQTIEDEIEGLEDYVQSIDIQAWNKI